MYSAYPICKIPHSRYGVARPLTGKERRMPPTPFVEPPQH
jgi:hypothetical protein